MSEIHRAPRPRLLERFRNRRSEPSKDNAPHLRAVQLKAVRGAVLGSEFSDKNLSAMGIREIDVPDITPVAPVPNSWIKPIRELSQYNTLNAATFASGEKVAGLAHVSINAEREVTFEIATAPKPDGQATSLVVNIGRAEGNTAQTFIRLQKEQTPVGCLVTLVKADLKRPVDGRYRFDGALSIDKLVEPAKNPSKEQLKALPNGAMVLLSGEVNQVNEFNNTVTIQGGEGLIDVPREGWNEAGLSIKTGEALVIPVGVVGKRGRKGFFIPEGTSPRVTITDERANQIKAEKTAASRRIYDEKITGLKRNFFKIAYSPPSSTVEGRRVVGELVLALKPDDPDAMKHVHELTHLLPRNAQRDEKPIITHPADMRVARIVHESSGVNLAAATRAEVLHRQPDGRLGGHAVDILSGRTKGAIDAKGTTKPVKAILEMVKHHFEQDAVSEIVRDQVRERMKAYEPASNDQFAGAHSEMRISVTGAEQHRLILGELITALSQDGSDRNATYIAKVLHHFLANAEKIDLPREQRNELVETSLVSMQRSVQADRANLNALNKEGPDLYKALESYKEEVTEENRGVLDWLTDHVDTWNAAHSFALTNNATQSISGASRPAIEPTPIARQAAGYLAANRGWRDGGNQPRSLTAQDSRTPLDVPGSSPLPKRVPFAGFNGTEPTSMNGFATSETEVGDQSQGKRSTEQEFETTGGDKITIAGFTDKGYPQRKPSANLVQKPTMNGFSA